MSRRRVPDEVGIAGILILVVVVMSLLSPNFRTAGNFEVLLLNGAVVALSPWARPSCSSRVASTSRRGPTWPSRAWRPPWGCRPASRGGPPPSSRSSSASSWAWSTASSCTTSGSPFIATFSMFGIAGSIPMILTGAASVTVRDPMFAFLGRGSVFGIPTPILVVALVAVVFSVLLARTSTGVHIYALGGNKETARLAGIHTGRTTLFVYAVSGLCAALAGVVTTSRLMVGYPSAGSGNELFYSIAAAVVGGVSLFGGVGSIGAPCSARSSSRPSRTA